MPKNEDKPTPQYKDKNQPGKESGKRDLDQKRHPEEEVVRTKGSENEKPKIQE